jgi:hypothetical protein
LSGQRRSAATTHFFQRAPGRSLLMYEGQNRSEQRFRKSGLNKVLSKLDNTPILLDYFTLFADRLD